MGKYVLGIQTSEFYLQVDSRSIVAVWDWATSAARMFGLIERALCHQFTNKSITASREHLQKKKNPVTVGCVG